MARGKKKDVNVRNEIQDALLREQAHVPIQLPPRCCAIHLRRLPHTLDDRKGAYRCTMDHL